MEVYHFKGKYFNEWKGQHRDGAILPTGTYYYVIKTNGVFLKQDGFMLTIKSHSFDFYISTLNEVFYLDQIHI